MHSLLEAASTARIYTLALRESRPILVEDEFTLRVTKFHCHRQPQGELDDVGVEERCANFKGVQHACTIDLQQNIVLQVEPDEKFR